jgi:hypothetical protein
VIGVEKEKLEEEKKKKSEEMKEKAKLKMMQKNNVQLATSLGKPPISERPELTEK